MDLNLDHWTTKNNVSDNVTEQGGKHKSATSTVVRPDLTWI